MPAPRFAHLRAGYRSAQDVVFFPSFLQPQTAEHLVDVPTIVSFYSLHGRVEQTVDIPVSRGCGGLSVGKVFKVYALERIQQRLVEQNTLTLQFRAVKVFKVLARDRFQLLHPLTHVVLRMRLLLCFSPFSPTK